MAKLVVLTEGFDKHQFELRGERVTVGRAEDNDIHLPDPSVSSHHCEILIAGGHVKIRDLNSTNGTMVDEVQVTEAVLRPNQVIRLGRIELRFEDPNAPASTAPVEKPGSKTTALPRGVNLGELGQAKGAPAKGFHRKTSTADRYFILAAVVVMLLILFLLVYVFKFAGKQ